MPQSVEVRTGNFTADKPFLRVVPSQRDKDQAPKNVIFAEQRFIQPDKQPPAFPSSGSINFSKDFAAVERIERSFEGRRGQVGRRYLRAHDPALDRAHFERCQTDEERHLFRSHLMKIAETSLRERAETIESRVVFVLDENGNAFNEKFPAEPVDTVIQRGMEYRKKEGSPDYERDKSGFEGWLQVRREAADPLIPAGTKWYLISGSEKTPGTTFTKEFVDAHEKVWDPVRKKWTIVLTRFTSGTAFEKYAGIATKLNPDYFVGQDGIRQEATTYYYASHPIRIEASNPRGVGDIFREEFSVAKGAAEENKFQSWWKDCTAIAEHYVDTICAKFFDPEKVKLTFNALLNKFDRARKGIIEKGRDVLSQAINAVRDVWDEINHLGRLPVEAIMVACGMSGGYSLDGIAGSVLGVVMGISARLGLVGADRHGSLEFQCPKCKRVNRRPYGKLIPKCKYKNCGADVGC